jgi:hypothetical protein
VDAAGAYRLRRTGTWRCRCAAAGPAAIAPAAVNGEELRRRSRRQLAAGVDIRQSAVFGLTPPVGRQQSGGRPQRFGGCAARHLSGEPEHADA